MGSLVENGVGEDVCNRKWGTWGGQRGHKNEEQTKMEPGTTKGRAPPPPPSGKNEETQKGGPTHPCESGNACLRV